jgi:hypothetical protein
MTRVAAFLLVALTVSSTASAQQSEPDTSSASIVTTAPGASPSREVWFQKDMAEANERVRKIRNSLIGTSAAFAAGVIIGGIGASQCQVISSPSGNNDEVLCNNAGNVMLPLGGTIAGLSAIGMITTGIMLGVAKKRRREIERDFRRSVYGRRLEWDPRGALRF